MTAPAPHVSESAAIVEMVAARLDRLLAKDDGPAALRRIAEADGRCRDLPGGGALGRLLALFEATEADRAVLLTCLAPAFDPRLLARYQDLTGRGWPTEWLASVLFAHPGQALLSEASALLRWRLVRMRADQPGEPPALTADPALRAWLAGRFEIPQALADCAEILRPPPPLAGWPVEATAARLARALGRGAPALLCVRALEGSGRASFGALVAEALGLAALAVDPGEEAAGWTAEQALLVHRLALVAEAAAIWRRSPPAGRLAARDRRPPPLQILTLGPGDPAPDPGPLAQFEAELPRLAPAERAELIDRALPVARGWSAETRALLANREALTPAAIARLGREAPEGDAEAIEATNRTQAAVIGPLAERMPPGLGWADIVLPAALAQDLRDLAYEARTRRQAWSAPDMARLFARERGLVALFHGSPGTGKTMAAQVIAAEMGVDLYRVDCGAVVSKYIGETAKNLGAIFARARRIDAVLFFDEADALFSRRTEVKDSNDRHANSDTAYMLQLIEDRFEGTALLATNRKSDIDPAFLRRIRYSFEFPRPSIEARTEIWRRTAAALDPGRAAALADLWPVVGASVEITGAQIKTVLLAAYFAARRQGGPLDAPAILRAAERELIKEGRTLGARERERIRGHA